MAGYDGSQVNEVLRLVKSLSLDGDVQLSILAHAFVTACRSCKVDREVAIERLEELFDHPTSLVALSQLAPSLIEAPPPKGLASDAR